MYYNNYLVALITIISALLCFSQENDCYIDGKRGYCETAINCKDINDFITASKISATDLLSTACGSSNGDVKICCPVQTTTSLSDVNTCGVKSSRSDSPWLVALGRQFVTTFSMVCTGVLITASHILGSSDCVDRVSTGEISHARMGVASLEEQGGQNGLISGVEGHSGFTWNRIFENNIAVFSLSSPVRFSETIRPICLPTSKPESINYIVSQWELLKERNRSSGYYVSLAARLVNLPTCESYSSYQDYKLNEKQICSYHVRSCNNIEIQPVLISFDSKTMVHSIIGVGAVGPLCKSGLDIPEIFTNVYQYFNWIQDITSNKP